MYVLHPWELQRRAWPNTENNNKIIRKPSRSKPVKYTSIDKIVSAQPGLVPRISGRHTREMITFVTCSLS